MPSPTDSPEFLLNGTPLGRHPDTQQLSIASITCWADHPDGVNLTRPVGLGFSFVKDGNKIRKPAGATVQRSAPSEGETKRGVTINFDTSALGGQVFDIEFIGRSICGRSTLVVRVIVPSS